MRNIYCYLFCGPCLFCVMLVNGSSYSYFNRVVIIYIFLLTSSYHLIHHNSQNAFEKNKYFAPQNQYWVGYTIIISIIGYLGHLNLYLYVPNFSFSRSITMANLGVEPRVLLRSLRSTTNQAVNIIKTYRFSYFYYNMTGTLGDIIK